jgi:cupin 2 domain-containing protein
MDKLNFFEGVSPDSKEEIFDTIIKNKNVKIERIVSTGQSSPQDFWYDQDENEWVIILEGYGEIEFFDGSIIELQKGDSLNIPAHTKHRVNKTHLDKPTIWLAVFY